MLNPNFLGLIKNLGVTKKPRSNFQVRWGGSVERGRIAVFSGDAVGAGPIGREPMGARRYRGGANGLPERSRRNLSALGMAAAGKIAVMGLPCGGGKKPIFGPKCTPGLRSPESWRLVPLTPSLHSGARTLSLGVRAGLGPRPELTYLCELWPDSTG